MCIEEYQRRSSRQISFPEIGRLSTVFRRAFAQAQLGSMAEASFSLWTENTSGRWSGWLQSFGSAAGC